MTENGQPPWLAICNSHGDSEERQDPTSGWACLASRGFPYTLRACHLQWVHPLSLQFVVNRPAELFFLVIRESGFHLQATARIALLLQTPERRIPPEILASRRFRAEMRT
jgi:hypothetical protein